MLTEKEDNLIFFLGQMLRSIAECKDTKLWTEAYQQGQYYLLNILFSNGKCAYRYTINFTIRSKCQDLVDYYIIAKSNIEEYKKTVNHVIDFLFIQKSDHYGKLQESFDETRGEINKIERDIDVWFQELYSKKINEEVEGLVIERELQRVAAGKSEKYKVGNQKTYLMYCQQTRLYKIGKSVNPQYRERTLQSEKPTVDLIYISNKDIEKTLHDMYQEKRVRGEWFNLTDLDVKNINKIFSEC